ncbi:hypothetical protein GCM10007971_38150 [Oceanobacillus indicireducens]|uniref:Uncharacterized protein n=1 Tax=Oceanobacillus indicireducens TaxID=1004261 RepID=A0A917Y5J2_9BACI|nr:hypothetical protein GCM10007971_38150 [Oceanobacillus indicireducens]
MQLKSIIPFIFIYKCVFNKEDEKDRGRLRLKRPVATSTLVRPVRPKFEAAKLSAPECTLVGT